MKAISQRWITIGLVERSFVRIQQWGTSGYTFKWRGNVAWSQPVDFVKFEDVLAAIRTRLRIARLEAIEIRCDVGPDSPKGALAEVHCLVRRRCLHPKLYT